MFIPGPPTYSPQNSAMVRRVGGEETPVSTRLILYINLANYITLSITSISPKLNTVCLDRFYKISYYLKWVKTSWTYSIVALSARVRRIAPLSVSIISLSLCLSLKYIIYLSRWCSIF